MITLISIQVSECNKFYTCIVTCVSLVNLIQLKLNQNSFDQTLSKCVHTIAAVVDPSRNCYRRKLWRVKFELMFGADPKCCDFQTGKAKTLSIYKHYWMSHEEVK